MARVTRVRRTDVLKLKRHELQVLVLELLELAVQEAVLNQDPANHRGRDWCVMTPNEVLEPIEDMTGRAW